MTIKEASHNLYNLLTSNGSHFPKWLSCTAVAEKSKYSDEEKLFIYIKKESDKWRINFNEFEGYPVEVVVMGEIVIGPPDD